MIDFDHVTPAIVAIIQVLVASGTAAIAP